MKSAIIVMISLAGLVFAGDPQKDNKASEPQVGELRRLDTVTWDLKTHTLSWVVVKGTEDSDGKFVPSDSVRYQVTPDDSKMGVASEERPIQDEEAALLHRLLDTLSVYCARSAVWWENADDTPATPATPSTPSLKPDRPTKQNDEPKAKPEPPKPVKVGLAPAVAALPQAK
jgi:hypothetical protein